MAEYSKKLHIRKDGTVQDISLYTDVADISTNDKLTIVDENTKVYAAIAETTKQGVSSLRVRKNNTVYAVLLKAIIYDLKGYYEKITNYRAITKLPEENMDYIKKALPNVNDCNHMLYNCEALTSIDTTGWDTSNVTNMSFMFGTCESLTNLNVSNWDTNKVTDMSYMFMHCTSLTTIDISNWDTSRVINMRWMFWVCSELTTIKGVIDMKSCTDCSYMFVNCNKLTGVKIKNPPADFETKSGLTKDQYEIVS